MPFRSEAQRRWMWANHPEMARRWEEETPPGDLPERVGKKKKSQFDDGSWEVIGAGPQPPTPNFSVLNMRKYSDFDDSILGGDGTRLTPYLRQIHKVGSVADSVMYAAFADELTKIAESQLEKGEKIEMEHASTIRAIKENPRISIREAARMIAKDHLKELSDYYTRLERMEGGKEKDAWSWEGFKEGLADEGIPLSGAVLGAAIGTPLHHPLAGAALGYSLGSGASLLRSKLKGEEPSTARRVLAMSGLGYGLGGLAHLGLSALAKRKASSSLFRRLFDESVPHGKLVSFGRGMIEEGLPALGATTATGIALATDKSRKKPNPM
jgi:hypothetical protein